MTPPEDHLSWVPSLPRIAYTHCGEGTPLIFLHGIGGSRHNWRQQLAHFAPHYQTVAWDARGYGDSDDYEGPCRFEDFSADLLRLLTHLGAKQAHLVGLSMGGRILMDFVDRYPKFVRSMVIAASFPSFGQSLTAEQQQDFMRKRREPLQSGAQMTDLAPALLASLLGPNATAPAREEALRSVAQLRPASYLKVLEATLQFDRTAELARSRRPTLLLYGECDTLVTAAAGRDVQTLVPHAQTHVIPGVGHLLNLEAPTAFNEAVERFLRQVDRDVEAA